MCHMLLSDARLYASLLQFDTDLAERAGRDACAVCGDALHRGDYPRKPRGVAASLVGEGYDERFSFCCSREGCRKRMTPPSVRFLGRRVYLGVIVVLAAAMQHGASPQRLATLRDSLGVSAQTLRRWRDWWLATFIVTPFWKAARGRFMPPTSETTIPASLVAKFGADDVPETWRALMVFLAPITTRSAAAMGCNSMG